MEVIRVDKNTSRRILSRAKEMGLTILYKPTVEEMSYIHYYKEMSCTARIIHKNFFDPILMMTPSAQRHLQHAVLLDDNKFLPGLERNSMLQLIISALR